MSNDDSSTWLSYTSLKWDLLSLISLDELFLLFISKNSFSMIFTAVWKSEVFNSDVNSLLHDTSVYSLLEFNTDSTWIDVEYDTSSTMIVFVWHTLVAGTIDIDVNSVTSVVYCLLDCAGASTTFTESTSKYVSGLTSITLWMSHFLERKEEGWYYLIKFCL